MKKPKILMIHTGGTLSMEQDTGGALASREIAEKIDSVLPELKNIAELVHIQIFSIDSSSIEIRHIKTLADVLDKNRNMFDGFVITHGTDTMAYTASALSFMFRNFNKPIVLTGAQRPLSEVRSDARINLIDAITVACNPNINEIVIVFDSTVFRGTRATKYKISEYDAFISQNIAPLAKLGVNIEFNKDVNTKKGIYRYYSELNSNIAVFKLFPGIQFENLHFLKEPDAIILDAFGSGNLAPNKNLITYIKKHQQVPIIIHSQVPVGRVNLNLYEAGVILKKLGAVGSGNITFEALIFKTMHLLSYTKNKRQFIKLIPKNLVGEIDY
ncbi:asparaginase [bacterium]|nr:asparaginase [bacterium]